MRVSYRTVHREHPKEVKVLGIGTIQKDKIYSVIKLLLGEDA